MRRCGGCWISIFVRLTPLNLAIASLLFGAFSGLSPHLHAFEKPNQLCEIVAEYGSDNARKRFSDLAFSYEACRALDASGEKDEICQSEQLHRRFAPFKIYPVFEADTASNLQSTLSHVVDTADYLNRFTNLEASVSETDFRSSARLRDDVDNAVLLFLFSKTSSDTLFRKSQEPNFFKRISQQDNPKTCAGTVRTYSDGSIGYTELYINTDMTKHDLRSCILEEMYGVMGLFNDPAGAPSLMTDDLYKEDRKPNELSVLDEFNLHFLYSSAVNTQTRKPEALDAFDKSLREICIP